jgi:transposase
LRKAKVSRRHLFETADKPAAQTLPAEAFQYAEWLKAKVHIDYHVIVDDHCYSVPFRLLHDTVDVRLTAATVEIFNKGERVAAHARSFAKHRHTTLIEHMPPDHRKYREWTPSRFITWAGKIGPSTSTLVESLLGSRAFPEQSYRSCLGVLRLAKNYSPQRLEAACARALRFNAVSFRSVRAILQRDLDQAEDVTAPSSPLHPSHDNIRGQGYYN